MKKFLAVASSVAAIAVVGVGAGTAGAVPPPCPSQTGFDAVNAHPGLDTARGNGGLQRTQAVNGYHSCR